MTQQSTQDILAINYRAEIAIELEHHNYRTFGGFVCLMQISTREEDFSRPTPPVEKLPEGKDPLYKPWLDHGTRVRTRFRFRANCCAQATPSSRTPSASRECIRFVGVARALSTRT